MLKKILSLTLSLVLALSLCTVSFAENNDVSEEIAHKYRVLRALKIMNAREIIYEDSFTTARASTSGAVVNQALHQQIDYDVFRNLSKSGFINFICNMYDDYGYTEQYSAEAIQLAEQMGIIHSGQTDLYKPLNYEEAVTMLVRALGYGEHAEESGGFPQGYIAIANRLGIISGVAAKPGEALQEHDAAILLYNTINCPYVEIAKITDEGIVYGNTSDDTFLYEYRRIYKVEGIVNGTETAALRTEVALDEGKMMIDGYIYNAAENFDDYLGLNVEAYVQEKDGDDNVLLVSPYGNKEIIVDSEDIASVSDDCRTIGYFGDKNKEEKLSISNIASVIYNGQPIKSYTNDTLNPADGSVRLVDNGDGSAYDVVFVTDYKTVVVDSVSYMNKTVKNIYTYNSENQILNLYENDDDIIDVIGDDGTEVQIADLIKGDVLKVAESKLGEKRVVKAYLSNKKVSGTILNMNKGDKTTLTVDGEKYVLSKAYEAALAANDLKAYKLEVGKSYTFSLDSEDCIAFAEDTDGLVKYAIAYAKASSGVFGIDCTVKLFTIDGEWKELKLAEKVELDEQGRLEAGAVIDKIPVSKDGEVSVIGYMTNSDGEIKYLDLPEAYNAGNDGRFNKKDKQTLCYRTGNVSFDSQVFIADDAKYWIIDSSAMNEEKAYQATKPSFSSNDLYTFCAFNIDEYNFGKIFVILQESGDIARNIQLAPLMIIDSVGETINAEGESFVSIMGASELYDSVTYFCEDDVVFTEYSTAQEILVSDLKKGDVIAVSRNNDGRIVSGKRYRSASDDVIYENPNTLHTYESIIQGVVKKHDSSGARMKVDCGEYGVRDMRIPSSSPIFIYDLERDQIRRGTVNDIEENNLILIKSVWNMARGFVVYQ